MQYMFYHLKIRNDYHCPTCRQPKIFFYNTLKEAYIQAYSYINNMNDTDSEMLQAGSSIWKDEWVRRNNGDKYQIIKIETNKEYELLKYYNDGKNGSLSIGEINEENIIKYMLLHIKVKTSKWCPDNIKYFISFHFTLETALYQCVQKNIGDKKDLLQNFESVWINNDNDSAEICPKGGDYYQIIEIKSDEEINLNKCCDQLKKLNYK
ncbi:hypothetical protein QLL95_gp0368 [Cotonvirus japonicus]|uniref:Uncharacterized protein n=1 Tax=Cotonvirus japonicus TaxID=2811091 RepID=A0ABM7NUA7_9VIRU|nr:hypothetical protein QLL95_gp0368 [Cotonvirus japonicus]BCS83755.1 hypothetical protein [Cotonvirus japonicus]